MMEASENREALYAILDELAKPVATRWSLVGDLADLIFADEDGVAARDWFEAQSDEFKERFWAAYSELEMTPLGIDDSTPEYETLFRDDTDYFDSEWLARRPVVASEKAKRGNVGADSTVAELNRAMAREARMANRAHKLHEALIVHDRRKVVVVWPKVARTADSGWYSEVVDADNTRKWFDSKADATAYVESLSAKLAAREVPVRVYRPEARVAA